MKPTSPVSLLLFLQLTSAAPLPVLLPANCENYLACQSFLKSTKLATPPTGLESPHFPPHQLPPLDSGSHPDDTPFDNAPRTPSANIPPSRALAAGTPLTSAFLLSLTHATPSALQPPSSTTDEDALPSKPTSALPSLRKLDSIRYWASLSNAHVPTAELETNISDDSVSPITRCSEYLLAASSSAYMRVGQPMQLARDYNDFLVVGIVVLFLAAVVVVELVQKVVDLRHAVLGTQRRGEIYLDDDDCAFISRKPFYLQPAPLGKKMALTYNKDFESDAETVVEAYYYDSDAQEKV